MMYVHIYKNPELQHITSLNAIEKLYVSISVVSLLALDSIYSRGPLNWLPPFFPRPLPLPRPPLFPPRALHWFAHVVALAAEVSLCSALFSRSTNLQFPFDV